MVMNRPSVVFVNRVYPPQRGATGRVLHDLARSFAKEGWAVTIITTGDKKSRSQDRLGINVVRTKGAEKPSGMLSYIWIWLKLLILTLRAPKAHLVVTLTDPPLLAVVGHIVKKIKRCRHIHWCQDMYPDLVPVMFKRFPKFLMPMMNWLSAKALRGADKIIVIGRCMARHMTLRGLNPRKLTMIPNWPDYDLVQASNSNTRRVPKIHLLQESDVDGAKPFTNQVKGDLKFRVMYAGNIGLTHPIRSILEAAEILAQSSPEIEFCFMGSGARFDEIASVRAEKGLENIKLMPYQPLSKLRDVLSSADVHLISMKEEAAGLLVPCKLYSALAVERPCIFIGPAHSEVAKVIDDFEAGSVVSQSDAKGLVEAILKYRHDSESWYAAHSGARDAANVFVPKEAINAWIERAWTVVKDDVA